MAADIPNMGKRPAMGPSKVRRDPLVDCVVLPPWVELPPLVELVELELPAGAVPVAATEDVVVFARAAAGE